MAVPSPESSSDHIQTILGKCGSKYLGGRCRCFKFVYGKPDICNRCIKKQKWKQERSHRLLHRKCISNQSTHGLTYQKALHQKYKPYTIIMFPLQKVRHHNRNRSFQNASFSIYHLAPPIRLPHPNTDSHLHLSLIHLCQSKSPSTE